ncbi:hypothetical protein [Pontibacter sp. G13]|uniref:hypothetical protein n=1 Tax=Pontibacter sp. G13 TaxID=3074898 RepID=UPI002889408B|nr:hypothetical protein [Pontibacter sp. G13]WNJ19854.1 hypothetical protein RJD25_05170 [Pontibacter sp. G13]
MAAPEGGVSELEAAMYRLQHRDRAYASTQGTDPGASIQATASCQVRRGYAQIHPLPKLILQSDDFTQTNGSPRLIFS